MKSLLLINHFKSIIIKLPNSISKSLFLLPNLNISYSHWRKMWNPLIWNHEYKWSLVSFCFMIIALQTHMKIQNAYSVDYNVADCIQDTKHEKKSCTQTIILLYWKFASIFEELVLTHILKTVRCWKMQAISSSVTGQETSIHSWAGKQCTNFTGKSA